MKPLIKSLDNHLAITDLIIQGKIDQAIESLEEHIVSWSRRSIINLS